MCKLDNIAMNELFGILSKNEIKHLKLENLSEIESTLSNLSKLNQLTHLDISNLNCI